MNRVHRDGTNEAVILRALASSPRGSLLTADLLPFTSHTVRDDLTPAERRQRALTRLGNEIRRLNARGMVKRAGRTAGGWQQGQVQCWRITPAGREQVAWWDTHDLEAELTERRAQRAIMRAARQGRKAQHRLLLSQAAAKAHLLTRVQRQQVAIELRNAGCTYQEIGSALGVTGQCALNDVRNPPYAPRLPRTPRPPRLVDGRKIRWTRRLEATPLAGLTQVTLTEW